MALFHNPKNPDGLVFAVDADNIKSYPGSGSTWYNIGGQANSGSMSNSPPLTTVDGVPCINFNGSNQKVTWSTNSTLNFGTGNFSVEVAYHVAYHTTYHHFWTFGNQQHFAFKANRPNSGNQRLYIYAGSNGPSSYSVITNTNLTLDEWGTAVMTRNGDTASIYINGEFKGSISGWVNANVDGSSNAPSTGNGWGSEYTKGNIKMIKVYNKALSAEEVSENNRRWRQRYGI